MNEKSNLTKNKKTFVFVLFLMFQLLFMPILTYAEATINITKTSSENITVNEPFNITITIQSNYNFAVNTTVLEPFSSAVPVKNLTIQNKSKSSSCIYCAAPPNYVWYVVIQPHSAINITYAAITERPGTLIVGPTSVTVRNKTYHSNSLFITVACNDNGICQSNLGENAVTCPYDCKTSEPPSNNTTPIITQIPTPIKNQTNTTVVNVVAPKNNNNLLIVLSVVFAIIIIILVVAIILTSSKHTDNEWMNKSTKK